MPQGDRYLDPSILRPTLAPSPRRIVARWTVVAGTLAAAALAASVMLLFGDVSEASRTWWLVAAIGAAAGLLAALLTGRRQRLPGLVQTWARLVDDDPLAIFVADRSGAILWRSRAASRRTRASAATLQAELSAHLADPAPVLSRLQSAAELQGSAREDIVTRRGPLHVAVSRLGASGFAWRIDSNDGRSGRAADALSLPMLTCGPGGTILFVNEAFRRLLGHRPRHLTDAFTDLPLRAGAVHHVRTPGTETACLVARVAGSGGRQEIYLLPADALGADGSEPWSIEDLPLPILQLDADGLILAASRDARALLPMPISLETRLSDILEGPGRPLTDWVADVIGQRADPSPVVLNGTGEHREFCVRVSLRPSDRSGVPVLIATLTDVSDLRRIEAQIMQSQKMQSLGQLAGGVAHDFNNLLTAILGHCELLLLRQDRDGDDHADLIQIVQNAHRAAGLVAQLLAFSRKQTQVLTELDLREALSDTTHLLSRLVGERIRVEMRQATHLDLVRADRRQLDQVMMNLVVNARDAMPDGGVISISTANRTLVHPLERDRARVPPGRYAVIEVKDTGTGMAPDRLTKIFEPFYTTKGVGEGTGLGLATVYGIVKQTGGYIFVDSVVGVGSTFTIWLPSSGAPDVTTGAAGPVGLPTVGGADVPRASPQATDAWSGDAAYGETGGTPELARVAWLDAPDAGPGRPDEPGRATPVTPAAGGGDVVPFGRSPRSAILASSVVGLSSAPHAQRQATVLLVEDEAPVRAFADRALQLCGYRVVAVDSGAAALSYLAAGQDADCVLTDVVMPGKDGPTWVAEALSTHPALRVVFMSGYAEETFAEQRRHFPGCAFLPKPFSLADLTGTVRGQIELVHRVARDPGDGTPQGAQGVVAPAIDPAKGLTAAVAQIVSSSRSVDLSG